MAFCFLVLGLLFDNVAASRVPAGSLTGNLRTEEFSRSQRQFHQELASINLLQQAEDCKCSFSGTCTCDEGMAFMTCIANACASGQCHCGDNGGRFMSACGALGGKCTSMGLQCQASHATCGVQAGAIAQNTTSDDTHIAIDDHQEAVEERKTHGHHLFGYLFLSLFATAAIMFSAVSSKNKLVSDNTWAVIDSIAVVSMAVTMFYVVQHLFDQAAQGAPHWQVALHVAYAVVLLFIAMFGAWKLKGNEVGLKSWNAVIYWMCLLAKGGALSSAQSGLSESYSHVFMVTGGAMLFLLLLMLVTHKLKPEPGFYDDVETNLMGGCLAGGICQLVGMLINGLDHHHESHQADEQMWLSNGFALFTCVLAIVCETPMMHIKEANGKKFQDTQAAKYYWWGRFLEVIGGVIGILPYFTVSIGIGVFAGNRLGVHPGTVTAKLVSTMASIAMGFLMIAICAFTEFFQQDTPEVKALSGLILGFGGYVAGYAMASLLTSTIDSVLEGRGYNGHELALHKIFVVAGFNCILIPVYVKFLKPIVIEKTKPVKN